MSIYGYCRISTAKQSIERQVRNIKEKYPEAYIIKETYTGTVAARPEWDKLRKVLKATDTIIFDSVSRMSRNADEGYKLYEELYNMKVSLVFLKEPHIDTDTYKKAISEGISMTSTNVDYILKGVNEYMLALAKEQIRIAFEQAEKEVADLRQRTKEGIMTARLNGKRIGRPPGKENTDTKKAAEAKQVIVQHSKTFGGSLEDSECIKLCGVSRNSYYKYKRELRLSSK